MADREEGVRGMVPIGFGVWNEGVGASFVHYGVQATHADYSTVGIMPLADAGTNVYRVNLCGAAPLPSIDQYGPTPIPSSTRRQNNRDTRIRKRGGASGGSRDRRIGTGNGGRLATQLAYWKHDRARQTMYGRSGPSACQPRNPNP